MMDTSIALGRPSVRIVIASAVVLFLAACGAKKHEATQAAARVDGAEITVHQINFRLQRERGLRPDQMDAASRKVLEQLIDEQLVVEKAEKEKVDKEPMAQQAMDAARRDVLSQAYVEQIALAVPAPTEDALHRYYDDNDALFAHRRIYTLQEYLAVVPVDKVAQLQALVDGGKPLSEITDWFKTQNIPVRGQQGVHAAEQIPLGWLKQLAALPDGRGMIAAAGGQVHLTYIVSSTSMPVSFERAKPAIAQFLVTDGRRKANEGNLAALRTAAAIEYSAPYTALAASGPALGTTKDVDVGSQIAPTSVTHVTLPDAGAASGVQITLPSAAPTTSVKVTLPTNTPSVRVSLPTAAASSVEVRLPPQTGGAAKN